MGRETKQKVVDQIAAHLGIRQDRLGPGSKEHRELLSGVAAALGLDTKGRKPELAKRIILSLEQPWGADCTSKGDTVTTEALRRILRGLRLRSSDSREIELYERIVSSRKRLRKLKAPPRGTAVPRRIQSKIEMFVRSSEVVAYVLEQARGICELCQLPAPFIRDDGTPFLEVHHVIMLREGGPDTVDNAVALCPNCHREAHHGCNIPGIAVRLTKVVARRSE